MRVVAAIGLHGACADEIALENYVAERERAICEWEVKCNRFATHEECIYYRAQHGLGPDSHNRAIASVEAGLARYDGEAAAACFDGYARSSCDTTTPISADHQRCSEVFLGVGVVGATCMSDLHCASGWCELLSCRDGCCTGSCQLPATEVGERCRVCTDGLYCGEDDVCHAEPGVGDLCDYDLWCGDGLYCVGVWNSTLPFVCEPLPGRGSPCVSPYAPCADARDTCVAGICTESALRGEPCATNFDCGDLYYCTIENRCEYESDPAQRMHDGQPCSVDDGCISDNCEAAVCVPDPICF